MRTPPTLKRKQSFLFHMHREPYCLRARTENPVFDMFADRHAVAFLQSTNSLPSNSKVALPRMMINHSSQS
jgi:hypothetical protein